MFRCNFKNHFIILEPQTCLLWICIVFLCVVTDVATPTPSPLKACPFSGHPTSSRPVEKMNCWNRLVSCSPVMEQLHSSSSQSDKAGRTAPRSLSNRWKLHCTFTCWLKVTLTQVGRVGSKSVKCCRKWSTITTTFVHGVHGCEGQKAEKAVYYKVEVLIVKHNYFFHHECIW